MAYEYIKNRKKYCQEYLIIAIIYLTCVPVVYYDYFIYSHSQGFNFTLGLGVLPFIFRGMTFVSGGFLLIKGLQEISKVVRKRDGSEDK